MEKTLWETSTTTWAKRLVGIGQGLLLTRCAYHRRKSGSTQLKPKACATLLECTGTLTNQQLKNSKNIGAAAVFFWFPTHHSAHESLPFLCHTRSLFSVPGIEPIWTNVCFTFPNATCHSALRHWNIVPPAQLGSPSICPGGGKMVKPVIRTWIVWTIRQFHEMFLFSLSLNQIS